MYGRLRGDARAGPAAGVGVRNLVFFLSCFVVMREADRAGFGIPGQMGVSFAFGLLVGAAWMVVDGG